MRFIQLVIPPETFRVDGLVIPAGLAAMGDDGLPYTTLMYANGPGYNYTVKEDEEEYQVSRWNITQEVATGWDYTQLAAVPRDSETHGGDDVAIYANGTFVRLERNFTQSCIYAISWQIP